MPEGNFTDIEPGLRRQGEKPWAFYLPRSADSFVVDRGEDVGFPCQGTTPDLGAAEFGAELPQWDLPKP